MSKIMGHKDAPLRILFVANAYVPTLQLNFIKPLTKLLNEGHVAYALLSEQQMKEAYGTELRTRKVEKWIDWRFGQFEPSLVVFCRYSGPHAKYILSLTEKNKIPCIYNIDDDLLNVPIELGKKKYEFHNHPLRLDAVKILLANVSLVYCSTEALKKRLRSLGYEGQRYVAGKLFTSGEVMVPATLREVKKIGYMGFDHAHDFELALPAIIRILRQHIDITFELFGAIPKPAALDEFGDRVSVIPPVPDYERFMQKFSTLSWDIGICPLAQTPFNEVKTNTKWVEYTSVGTAVIATGGTIYDACCSDNCGLLVKGEEEWIEALSTYISKPEERFNIVKNAQKKLVEQYSLDRLREQVLDVFSLAAIENSQESGSSSN